MCPGEELVIPDARTVRMLTGLSGARVLLLTKDDRHWFVRKMAREPSGNDRLRGQMAKQIVLGQVARDVVRTPRVLEQGELDGRFFFDMEFIRGTDGATYLRRANYSDVVSISDRFCAYLQMVAGQATERSSSVTLFEALYGKLCEVQQKTSLIEGETLARLFMALEPLRALGERTHGTLCHGDLTLENIIVDDQRNLWMIDLLDAPFEHYWQDVAKLHQDLEGGWYLLSQAPVAKCVLEYISRRLLTAVATLDDKYASVHAVLLACTFVRILPYVRTLAEQQFVQQRIDHFARIAHAPGGNL